MWVPKAGVSFGLSCSHYKVTTEKNTFVKKGDIFIFCTKEEEIKRSCTVKLLVLVQTSMAPAAPRERTMRAMKALGRTMYILIPMKSFRRLQGQKPTCKPINRCCDVCSALGSRMAVGTVPLKKPGTLLFETLGSGQLLVRSVKHSSALTCSCP